MGVVMPTMFYVFSTEANAIAAEQLIVENVRQWVEANAPDALTPENWLRGRNAANGQLNENCTTRWAVPVQVLSGQWIFEKPTADRTRPVPIETVLQGIIADESMASPAWFGTPVLPS